ncbi:MAG: YggU family protein [Thermodesulfobacteria bacterium]|nr:YggU family protein [Thermodesulfobacteriota bacterium]
MLKPYREGLLLEVHLKPRAKKDEIQGTYAGSLKISLKAPPVEGKANEALLKFLAKRLDLPRRRLKIVSGLTSRRKSIYIEGLAEDEVRRRLGI